MPCSAGPLATLILNPAAAINPVETQHCVTATVQDALVLPVPDVSVCFTVTGAVNTSGSATTDASGQATFCYMGPALPGADAISAFADTDDNSTQDVGEPTGAVTKTWGPPVTTPGCKIIITNGGWIIDNNGDHASFGRNAKADGNVSRKEEAAARSGAPRRTGWGSAALLSLGLDTRHRTGYGRTSRSDVGGGPREKAAWGEGFQSKPKNVGMRPREYLTEEEVESLIDAVHELGRHGPRHVIDLVQGLVLL